MENEAERVANLLERLELGRFTLKEMKHFDDLDHRAVYSSRPGKMLELAYSLTFNYDILVTHLEIQVHLRDTFIQLFEVGEIEASCLTNRGIFAPVVRNGGKVAGEGNRVVVPALAITQALRISILLKKEFQQLCGDVSFRKERSKAATEENVGRVVSHAIKAINVCGYYLSMNTSASQLVPLLNISQSFKQSRRFDEAAQVDILVSLSLISARRFVQASELLKKASRFYVDKYIASKTSMELSRLDRSWIREEGSEVSGASRSFAGGRVLDGGKYLYKAAKIELLLAETINQPSLVGEKLEAYHRANCYAAGNVSPGKMESRVDYEETVYTLGGSILPFLLRMLTDKSDILKISSLKAIQFFYENLGCSLGSHMPVVLRSLIAAYPGEGEGGRVRTEENQGNQLSNRTKLILDHINHLLESLLALLPSMNKKYLRLIFDEVIVTCTPEDYRSQLRLYLLRFGEKILQACGADLEIPMGYIRHVMAAAEGKPGKQGKEGKEANKHISHNLTYFSQRILDILKIKVLRNYRKQSLRGICSWAHETLISLCENEALPASSQLVHVLDFIVSIYGHTSLTLLYPVEPVIYLLNSSLHQPKLPFDKILQALIVLVVYGNRPEHSFGLGGEIIQRIMGRSKICTLSLKELRILEKVVEVEPKMNVRWLEEFLDCIPHSNFDQVYSIFDRMLEKCLPLLDKRLLSLIVDTLLNQYTVKGKAHQHSKERLIASLLLQPAFSFTLFLELCLFENPEAEAQNYYSRNSVGGQHCFDTKLFKLHSQLFLEKINLLLLVLSKTDLVASKFQAVFSEQTVARIDQCIKKLLFSSTSFKVKGKALILIKQLLAVAAALKANTQQKIFLFKTIMRQISPFLSLYKDSKLHYNAILNIGLAVDMVQTVTLPQKSAEISSNELPEKDEEYLFKEKIQEDTRELAICEVVEMWPTLTALFNSPWESVREILMLVILNCFRKGLTLSLPLRQKAGERIQQLLQRLLLSGDFSERLMGVKLFGGVAGLAQEWQKKQELAKYLNTHWAFLRGFVEKIGSLEGDCNQEVSACSKVIAKICLSNEAREAIGLRHTLQRKCTQSMIENSIYSWNLEDDANLSERKNNSFTYTENLDNILRTEEDFKLLEDFQLPPLTQQIFNEVTNFSKTLFRLSYANAQNTGERDSFAEDEQDYFDPNDQRHSEKQEPSRSEEEQLQFEDLGIIELDDEEWGQEESQIRITQRLPLKKVYKLSPNLASGKHHRLGNQRYHDFEEDKIIVDQLEGRINYPQLPPNSNPNPNSTVNPIPLTDISPSPRLEQHPYLQRPALKIEEAEQPQVSGQGKGVRKQKKAVKKRKPSGK